MENNISAGLFNVGTGEDITIRELAETVTKIVEFQGEIVFDYSKPDGTPRKLLSIDLIKNLGWQRQTKLKDGINKAYQDFLKQYSD